MKKKKTFQKTKAAIFRLLRWNASIARKWQAPGPVEYVLLALFVILAVKSVGNRAQYLRTPAVYLAAPGTIWDLDRTEDRMRRVWELRGGRR